MTFSFPPQVRELIQERQVRQVRQVRKVRQVRQLDNKTSETSDWMKDISVWEKTKQKKLTFLFPSPVIFHELLFTMQGRPAKQVR